VKVKDAKKEDAEGMAIFLMNAWMGAGSGAMGWIGASEKNHF
jgi:hypothetical protein